MSGTGCVAYLVLEERTNTVAECEREIGHGGKHRAVEIFPSFGERPRGGKARRDATVTLEWR